MGKRSTTGGRSLHVFGALSRGGAETWFLQALRCRTDHAWSADICLLAAEEGPCVPEARALGTRVLRCPFQPAATFPARLFELLRRERYDVVHSHVLLFSGLIAALADHAGTPLRVAHAHNSSDGRADGAGRSLYRAVMRSLIARHANLTLACSEAAAAAFACPQTRILPYGIDLQRFRPAEASLKARFGIPESACVFGAAGRLTAQKNYGFLLEAFAAALRRGADIHLMIAGDGELRGEIERRIAALGIGDRIHRLGLRDDIPELLTGLCDAFVMPSLYEGLPVALLEAQAAGLPCFISDAIAPETTVLAELVARLPLDAQSWADALALPAPLARLELQTALERLRAAGFDAGRSWSSLTTLYDEALAAEREARAA
jgi:glycosyltransferase EpsF